jgi:hypothetical protein
MYVPGRAESNKENENKIERRAGPLPEVVATVRQVVKGAFILNVRNLRAMHRKGETFTDCQGVYKM